MPETKRGSRTPALVPKRFARDRKQVLEFIRRGQALAKTFGAPALLGEIEQLAESARKPFLFVAVGEVKTGKSSLINALLESPVCAVDTAPCTDRVQEINYGEKERRVEVSEFEERLYLPHAILRHITIVDTPGTNSIIRGHQRITENYIPQSDLLLFVFFAKNPYTGSAWDLLHHINHDWQRNTLFVLQQADLLSPEELERTQSLVEQQLAEEGIANPVVFRVSVLTGEGLDTLRDYLRTEVVKGRHFNKNISLTHNLLRFLRGLEGELREHACLVQHDQALLEEFRQLVVGSGNETEQAYETLAALARHRIEQTRQWLDEHFGGTGRGLGLASNPGSHRKHRLPLRTRLRQLERALLGSVALRDAVSVGWETSSRVGERFNRLQGELNRCLFDAQLRSLELWRQQQRQAQQLLQGFVAQPRCQSKPLEDALARRRLRMLQKTRREIDAVGAQGLEEPVPRLPPLHARSRWSRVERLSQAGAGLGSLLLGYYLGDLFTGLLLGPAGYLGVGYGLAKRRRARVSQQARAALERGLADLEQRLHATLLARQARLQGVLQDALGRCERNLAKRRAEMDKLHLSISELREAVERYESSAWLDAVQDED